MRKLILTDRYFFNVKNLIAHERGNGTTSVPDGVVRVRAIEGAVYDLTGADADEYLRQIAQVHALQDQEDAPRAFKAQTTERPPQPGEKRANARG